MNRSQQRDLVREYFEAKLQQRLGRRGFLQLSGGLVVATAASGFLAACSTGGASSAPSAAPATAAPATPRPSVDISGATIEFIGLDGEDAAKVASAAAWRDERGIKLASKYIGTGDEIFAAMTAGQQFDIAITFNPYINRVAAAKLVKPIDTSRLTNTGRIVFGASVELENQDEGGAVKYQIVGEDEADIRAGRISITSPIARALVGKSEGDVVDVDAPGGVKSFEVVSVHYE